MKPDKNSSPHPPAAAGTTVYPAAGEGFSSQGTVSKYMKYLGIMPEQAQQIIEIIEALSKLENAYLVAQAEEMRAKIVPRCSGHEHWDKDIYLYANHGVRDECPLHGSKKNGRVRKYIGTDSEKIAEVQQAMKNYRTWQAAAKKLREADARLGYLKDAINEAHKKRSGRYRRWSEYS